MTPKEFKNKLANIRIELERWAARDAPRIAGKTGIIFNEENSYNQKVKGTETRLNIRRRAELSKDYLPYNTEVEAGDNKVYVNDFADTKDLEQNLAAAKKIAKELAKDIYIRPHINVNGHKNPEFAIGRQAVHGDLKTYSGRGSFDNFVRARIKSANNQGAQYAVLDITKQPDISNISNLLYRGLNGINSNIARIILIKGKQVVEITRKQIEKFDFSAIDKLQ